jgi:predicted PurR-regulated permease PerM
MARKGSDEPAPMGSSAQIDLAIRFGFVALLGYWSITLIAPLLSIALWSAILAVSLHPAFEWLARYLRWRPLAATVVSLLCAAIVIGPITWLGLGLIGGVGSLVKWLEAGQLAVPRPAEYVKAWPLIGDQLHRIWSLAATNMAAAVAEAAPMLKPVGVRLLGMAQGALTGLLELLVSIFVAGFLLTRGLQLADALSVFLGRILSHRGREMVQLAGATIQNVSRGVVGVALAQAVLAGAAFVTAGVPAPNLLAFIVLVLGIIQIGPAIVFLPVIVWSWMELTTAQAALFTAYMIPVGLMDNVLRPILMARGLTTPAPVIVVGVLGGILAYGMIGVFLGPIVLSVAWAVLASWTLDVAEPD